MKKLVLFVLLLSLSVNASDSLFLDVSDSTVHSSYINTHSTALQKNFGGDWDMEIGSNAIDFPSLLKILLRSQVMGDSMANHSGVTWDSAQFRIVFDYKAGVFTAGDSIGVVWYDITNANWIEGTGSGTDAGGVTPDSAVDASGGDTGYDWTTDGGDYNSTPLGDTIWIDDSWANKDTLVLSIPGSHVADTLNGGGGLIIVPGRIVASDNHTAVGFYTERQPTSSWRPSFVLYYSASSGSEPTRRRRMLLGGVVEKGEVRDDGKVVVGEMIDWDKNRLIIEGATR